MRLQINMHCNECDDVLPVIVKADDKFEISTTKKHLNTKDVPNIYEQISCPSCGEENLWDPLKRNFTSN